MFENKALKSRFKLQSHPNKSKVKYTGFRAKCLQHYTK